MKLRNFGLLITSLFLSGCGLGVVGSSNNTYIELNADVQAISDAVAKFDANSKTSGNVTLYSDFENIYKKNGVILDEAERAVDIFLADIVRAGSKLPNQDTKEIPSKSKLVALANGYKTWVYYQKLNQTIGGVCINRPADWMNCLIEKLPETMPNETKSTNDLKIAIQGIEDWRKIAR